MGEKGCKFPGPDSTDESKKALEILFQTDMDYGLFILFELRKMDLYLGKSKTCLFLSFLRSSRQFLIKYIYFNCSSAKYEKSFYHSIPFHIGRLPKFKNKCYIPHQKFEPWPSAPWVLTTTPQRIYLMCVTVLGLPCHNRPHQWAIRHPA